MQLFLGNQPGLAGSGQPVDLRTHVVLRNMSAGSVGVSATASFTVVNIGDKEEAVTLNLAYAGGAVELPAFPLAPGQSQTVNLRRDLARMLQGAGKALPEGAVFGGYDVRSVEDPLRAELVVKEHVLSASKKTAAPFYGHWHHARAL